MDQKDFSIGKLSLWSITWPIFIETSLRMLLGNVDTFMLSHYSDEAVAAVGMANQILMMLFLLYNVVGVGTVILISQCLGARDHSKANNVAIYALALNTVFGLAISIIVLVFARDILILMNIPNELLDYGTQFLRIMGGVSFLQSILATSSAIVRSHGKTQSTMIIAGLMNVLNVIGNFIVLYGLFGLPVLGVTGVAVSTILSQIVAVCLILNVIYNKLGIKFSIKSLFPIQKQIIQGILKIGLPSAGENIAYQSSQLMITFMITYLGTQALTTRVYAFNLMWFIMLTGIALGQGTQILVGHCVGAKKYEEAYRICIKSLYIGLTIAFCVSVLFFLGSKHLFGIFTDDESIISVGSSLLALCMILEPGRVFNLVVINSLKAAGDVKFPVIIGVFSMWGVAVLFSYILAIVCKMGLPGIWIALAADEWMRGLIMMVRWRSRVWTTY